MRKKDDDEEELLINGRKVKGPRFNFIKKTESSENNNNTK
jgi:hypothetical protein